MNLNKVTNYLSEFIYDPKVCVMLGSGLDNFTEIISNKITIPYADIPSFVSPVSGATKQLRDCLDFRPIKSIIELPKPMYDTKVEKITKKTHGQLIIKEYPTASAHALSLIHI